MKITTILIKTDTSELEFENLDIDSLALLDPWVDGKIKGKIKANGLALGGEPAPLPQVVLPEPNPSHASTAKRNQGRGMTLYALQHMAKRADEWVPRSELLKVLAREGFRNSNSVSATITQAIAAGYLAKNGTMVKITKKGVERAMDQRLLVRKETHVHAGEGVITQKN